VVAIAAKNKKDYAAMRLSDPEKIRAKDRILSHTRRVRSRDNGGKLSIDLVPRLLGLQKGKCRACGKPLKNDYHIDHIMPIKLGGTNTDGNCQLLHSKCNMTKGAKLPHVHAQQLGVLFI